MSSMEYPKQELHGKPQGIKYLTILILIKTKDYPAKFTNRQYPDIWITHHTARIDANN